MWAAFPDPLILKSVFLLICAHILFKKVKKFCTQKILERYPACFYCAELLIHCAGNDCAEKFVVVEWDRLEEGKAERQIERDPKARPFFTYFCISGAP